MGKTTEKQINSRCPYCYPIIAYNKRILIVLVFFLLLSGCSGEKSNIKETVAKYNKLLSEGYLRLNMTSLREAATEKCVTKAYVYMSALGEAKVKMDARLKEMKFSDIKILPGERAEVRTHEKWDYAYIDINSGKTLSDNSIDYEMKYTLEKKSGRWLVADISVEKSVEKKSGPDIFHRPKE